MGKEKAKKWVSFNTAWFFSEMIPHLSLSENQALFMVICDLLEITVMTWTFQSQCPVLPASFVHLPPPYALSYHHLLWQFNITSFLAPFSWTKMSLAAEGDSHKPLDFHYWIKSLFLQGTKGRLPGDLSPTTVLRLKTLAELLKCSLAKNNCQQLVSVWTN